MSADFLTSYLAFGPLRHKIGKASSPALPVFIDPITVQEVTGELVELARVVRQQAGELPEYVIR